jgi:hypothetical protein
MKTSLHAQTSAVDVAAVQAMRRGNPSMTPKAWEDLEPGLKAATLTLMLLQSWRSRLPADFIAEIEGER